MGCCVLLMVSPVRSDTFAPNRRHKNSDTLKLPQKKTLNPNSCDDNIYRERCSRRRALSIYTLMVFNLYECESQLIYH